MALATIANVPAIQGCGRQRAIATRTVVRMLAIEQNDPLANRFGEME